MEIYLLEQKLQDILDDLDANGYNDQSCEDLEQLATQLLELVYLFKQQLNGGKQ